MGRLMMTPAHASSSRAVPDDVVAGRAFNERPFLVTAVRWWLVYPVDVVAL